MQTLETPTTEGNDTWQPLPINGDAAMRADIVKETRVDLTEESGSRMETS